MRRKMILMFLLFGACVFVSGNSFAAWTQAKGHSYNQLTLGYYHTTKKTTTIVKYPTVGEEGTTDEQRLSGKIKRTNASPYRQEEEEFNQYSVTYYGEFGVLEDLTAVFSVPYNYIRSNDVLSDGNTGPQGVGDINFGLRRKISNNLGGGVLMSVQADIKIPEAYDYGDPIFQQSLGDGQYDYSLKAIFGKGFSKGYSVLDIGYKYRDYNKEHGNRYFKPSDTFFVSLSAGYNATSWLSIRGKVDWTNSIGNAVVSDDMILYGETQGVLSNHAEAEMILDTLGLEKNSLSAGVSLAFTITPKIQTVLTYNTDLVGFGEFRTENAGLGQTFNVAFVYMH